MKRFLIMLVICVSSFMIYTNNVNAANSNNIKSLPNITYNSANATISNWSVVGTTYVNFDLKPTNVNSTMTLTFDNVTIPQYSNYFTLPLSLLNMSNDTTLSCNNEYISGNIIEDINFSTTYADGSQAQNSGTIESSSNIYRYCNSFHYNNDDFGLYIHFTASNNNQYSCPIVSSGNEFIAICPIQSGLSNGESSFNSITIRTFFSNPNTDTFRFRVSDKVTFSIDSTQTILNAISNQTNSINSKLDELKQNQQATTQAVKDQTDTIKSDNTSGAEGSADDLKNNSAFQDNTGLSGVISMPLTFVNSLTNTCQPINLNIPYMDVDVTIPCMQSVITDKMPLLANLIKIIVNGFIVYRILLDIFQIVRNAKNPEDDRIEVLDL